MRKRRASQSGFTLVETVFSIVLMGLILACAMAIFIVISRNTIASQSLNEASIDSGKSTAFIVDAIRSSAIISLPGDQDFQSRSGYSASNYQTSYDSSTVSTGMTLWFPASGSNIQFPGTSASYATFDRTNVGSSILFYRSDPNGTPDASAGTCLWASGTMNGIAYNQAIITSIAPAPNAVQFLRPNVSFSSEIAVKIVSSFYNPVSGESSNESAGQYTTTISGSCVMSRDVYTGTNSSISQSTTTMVSGGHWYAY